MTAIKNSSDLQILFENSDWLAVNKPTEISIHNTEDPQNLLSLFSQKMFPVHRLDKETSGVQILAKNERAAQQLAGIFQSREVLKIYHGLLRGSLKTPTGVWNKPLSDKAEGRKNPQGVSADRVPCETGYKVLQSNKFFTHCEFNLITGRQHQIRKHTALEGHHLIGDPRYGDPKFNQKMAEIYKTSRLFLHCSSVTLMGQKLEATVPTEFSTLMSV